MSIKTKSKDRQAKRERQFKEAIGELFPSVEIEKLRGFMHGDWDECIGPSLERLLVATRSANDTEESIENIRINQAVIYVLKYLFSVKQSAETAIQKIGQ